MTTIAEHATALDGRPYGQAPAHYTPAQQDVYAETYDMLMNLGGMHPAAADVAARNKAEGLELPPPPRSWTATRNECAVNDALLRTPLRVLTLAELLTVEIPEREVILAPWLLTQSLTMIHAYRGIGKTHVALGIGYAVASGGAFLCWQATRARSVLYLDGEMPAAAMRDRLAALVQADERDFDPAMLRIVTPDMQDGPMPDLATTEGQLLVERVVGDAELIIVDNISTLVRSTERENDAESWREVGAWALRARQRGRSVVFIHHDGKGGQQRGTSKREDTLDAVIQLKHPPDYSPENGARFEVHFRKQRNSAGEDAKPIEAALSVGPDGRQSWTYRTLEDSTFDRVVELARDGLRVTDIAAELGVAKSNVSRHIKKAKALGLLSGVDR